MAEGKKGRLAFIQFGDFRAAWRRLSNEGKETYQAQRISVDQVVAKARDYEKIVIVDVATDGEWDEVLPCGVRVVALGPDGYRQSLAEWNRLLAGLQPDEIVLRSPIVPVLQWAERHRHCRMLVTLADSFQGRGLRARLRRWWLARLLNQPMIEFVGNHGRRASFQLRDMGVRAGKIIPWDWPPVADPHALAPKAHPGDRPFHILFVGMMTAEKGVDDLIDALALLRGCGTDLTLDLVGKGESDRLRDHARGRGVEDAVTFVGLVPNQEVAARMRAADLVVVPSRKNCPEGLPLTIYEALCSRTPLIVSDHPMFAGNVVDGQDGLVFEGGDASSLANEIEALIGDAALYGRLSENSAAAWERLQIPVTWGEMLDRWLDNGPEDVRWLKAHALSSGLYDG